MAKKKDTKAGVFYSPGPITLNDQRDMGGVYIAPWNGKTRNGVVVSCLGPEYRGQPFVFLGIHAGRYLFFLVNYGAEKGARIRCGCREFTYDEAMKNWKNGITNDKLAVGDKRRPHHRALVKCAREIAKINGWKF